MESGVVVGEMPAVAPELGALSLHLVPELIAGVVEDPGTAAAELGYQRQGRVDMARGRQVEEDEAVRAPLPVHRAEYRSAPTDRLVPRIGPR